jgi:hypothetical protein
MAINWKEDILSTIHGVIHETQINLQCLIELYRVL